MNDQITGPVGRLLNTISQGVSIRNPLPRAGARFKNEIAKLPLRLAHAAGLKCATVAPGQDEQSRYLSSLSQGEMNPMRVMMELPDLIGDNGQASLDDENLRKLSDSQLYRIYRNMKEHGELFSSLRDFIGDKVRSEYSDDQGEVLRSLRGMLATLENTRNAVEVQLAERNIAIDFKVDATVDDEEKQAISLALNQAWKAAGDLPELPASAHLDKGFRDVMLERSADGGNERAAKLIGLHKKLWQEGKVDSAALKLLLTDALRRAGVKHPEKDAGRITDLMVAKQDMSLLAELYEPLYHEFSQQIVGLRTDKVRLLGTIEKIRQSAGAGEKPKAPDLGAATVQKLPNEQAAQSTKGNAAKEVEASPEITAVNASGVEPEDTHLTIPEVDGKVFNDYLVKCFTEVAKDANAGKVIKSHEIDAQISRQLKSLPRKEVLQIRDFFNRHLWIPSYFAQGDTNVEDVFSHIAASYARHSNIIMLDGRTYEPVPWAERQDAKMERFERALMSYGLLKGADPDPSIMLQEYVNGLGSGREVTQWFDPFLKYFNDEERQFGADLLTVRNRLDYIEILSDIADSARAEAWDSEPETFRILAGAIVGSIAWRPGIVEIARRYSAVAEITPVATRAREESRRTTVKARQKANEIAESWRKADEIAIVAGCIRDHLGGIAPSPSREERLEFERYQKRIADRKGDVYQALWELRAEEAKRPARPRRMARVKAKQPPVAQSPSGLETPMLSPRSRSTLDSIIDDLGTPRLGQTPSELADETNEEL